MIIVKKEINFCKGKLDNNFNRTYNQMIFISL